MRLTLAAVALMALAVTGCKARWVGPEILSPPPEYVEVSASPQDAWDAAVDYLVDTGTQWDFISDEMHTARMEMLVTRGPFRSGSEVVGNEAAQEFADCGQKGGATTAGWGMLWAAVAIRVRPGDGTGSLLKVVVPQMWQTSSYDPDRRCTSTGALEALILEGIQSRFVPIVRRDGR